MSLSTMDDLFLHEVKDLYDAEKQIVKALPKMIKAVECEELQTALEEHLAVTEKQVERLEEVFSLLEKPARGKKCAGMEGLLKEGSSLLEEDAEPAVLAWARIETTAIAHRVERIAAAAPIRDPSALGIDTTPRRREHDHRRTRDLATKQHHPEEYCVERAMGFEPTTCSLGSCHSTN